MPLLGGPARCGAGGGGGGCFFFFFFFLTKMPEFLSAPPRPTPAELLNQLLRGRTGPLLHVRGVPARGGDDRPRPSWIKPELLDALGAQGITAPWRHQVEAAELVRAGNHVIISTGTASGKSLGYLLRSLPICSNSRGPPRSTSHRPRPVAADQLRSVLELGLPDVRPSGYDGDTPHDEREWVRAHSRLVLTNPDMLHHSILPRHERWSTFLRRLAFVIIDEVTCTGVCSARTSPRFCAVCAGCSPRYAQPRHCLHPRLGHRRGTPSSSAEALIGLPCTRSRRTRHRGAGRLSPCGSRHAAPHRAARTGRVTPGRARAEGARRLTPRG